jgi:hypothetical protein
MARGDVESTERVEIRAFRGNRRASVYRSHVIGDRDFDRILGIARRRELTLLPSLGPSRTHELGKREARRLAQEATALRMSGELADLDHELTAIAELARWCARTSGQAWVAVGAFRDPDHVADG